LYELQSVLKTVLKRFVNFLLFGNIYVALGALCLIQSTAVQLQLNTHLIPYSLLVFFATLFVYNFQRIFYAPQENTMLHSVRRTWIFRNPVTTKILAFIGFTGVVITFFYVDFHIAFYLLPLLVLSLAYFAPFVKLRKNAFFKLLTLVTVWTMVTAVVPILLTQESLLDTKNSLHLLIRFCFMTAICIPFDIRDLKIDEADNISTIPRILGENQTRRLALAFMIIYSVLIVLAYYLNHLPAAVFMMLLLSAVLNTLLVVMSSSKRSEYFFVAGIDGTMILQGVLLIGAVYL
jgi:4-hydroxybenzoate polyprenyltransferase